MNVDSARKLTKLALNYDTELYFTAIQKFIEKRAKLGYWESKMIFINEGVSTPNSDTKEKINYWLEYNGYTYSWTDGYLYISWE